MTDQSRVPSTVARGLLAVCAAYQVALGIYFIIFRPSLLPEDLRFIGSSAATLEAEAPRLDAWLQWVFTVMGGQMIGVGILVLLVATRERHVAVAVVSELPLLAIAAGTTVLLMCSVNFAIGSDFRWALILPVALWALALFCYWRSPAQ